VDHWGSARSIQMRSVVNSDDEDGVSVLVDPEKNSVVAAGGGPVAAELVTERFAELGWVVTEYAGDEFDDRHRDPVGEPVQCSARVAGKLNTVWSGLAHLRGRPDSAASLWPPVVSPWAYCRSASATESRMPGWDSQ